MNTLEEYKENLLRQYDADLLLEKFQISAKELLDRFEDKVIEAHEAGDEDDG